MIPGALQAALVLVTGAIAAVAAHVTIDVLGDFLLTRDTYDGIAHYSRTLFIDAIVLSVALIVVRAVWEAFDRRPGASIAILRRLTPQTSPWRFVTLVVVTALVVLLSMERADAIMAGTAVHGIGDLLGGSIALGASAVAAIGALTALAMHAVITLLGRCEPAIAAFFDRMMSRLSQRLLPRRLAYRWLGLSVAGACRLAWRAGKRAPPLPTPA